ncbi:hypothetical protein [Micromonospora sp. HM5-17]|uniref:hypothetical protein n=1 Tax=Micromonospora sp. HM5-17 TaxID=2487710 RepID=UPI0013154D2E|nr:hypothetical protein [Micromonospora sp. HM5-17]
MNGSVTRWVSRNPGSSRVASQPTTASSITSAAEPFPGLATLCCRSCRRCSTVSVPK